MFKKRSIYFLTPEQLSNLYELTLGLAKDRNSYLFDHLHVHAIHRESVGYWSSLHEILNRYEYKYEERLQGRTLPDLKDQIVVPMYLGDMSLGHLRIIGLTSKNNIEMCAIGPSHNGWFNIMNSSRALTLKAQASSEERLVVYDSLTTALSKDSGVHSDVITDINMSNLKNITMRLALKGDTEFINRFTKIQGFDITIGNTNQNIAEFTSRDFCFNSLLGLDLRAVIPRAVEYIRALPHYERSRFNAEFIKIFKVDLKNEAPYLFDSITKERDLIERLKATLFKKVTVTKSLSSSEGVKVIIRTEAEQETLFKGKPDPVLIAEALSFKYGDIIDLCYHKDVGAGLPSSYTWNPDTGRRLNREDTHRKVGYLFYMIVLGLLKDAKKE